MRPTITGVGQVPAAQPGLGQAGTPGADGTAGSGGGAGIAGSTAASAGSGGAGGAGGTNAGGACDMSGRWMITRREVADGLGQLQSSHSWLYYEIEQQGEQLTITRSLNCGHDVTALTPLGANADMSKSWPSVLAKSNEDGRTGTSKVSAGGCDIHFDKIVRAEGVTVPYYDDPAVPLATVDEPASGSTPGWEDWDEDGHPGITITLSGGITGDLYVAIRAWNELSGTAPSTAGTLKLASDWGQNENVLGYNGSPLLTSQGVRAADASLHFAELARLGDDQATGDDTAVCAAIRALAPMLTPNANN